MLQQQQRSMLCIRIEVYNNYYNALMQFFNIKKQQQQHKLMFIHCSFSLSFVGMMMCSRVRGMLFLMQFFCCLFVIKCILQLMHAGTHLYLPTNNIFLSNICFNRMYSAVLTHTHNTFFAFKTICFALNAFISFFLFVVCSQKLYIY